MRPNSIYRIVITVIWFLLFIDACSMINLTVSEKYEIEEALIHSEITNSDNINLIKEKKLVFQEYRTYMYSIFLALIIIMIILKVKRKSLNR